MPLKHSVEEIILKNGARGLLINTPDSTSVHYDIHFWGGTLFAADSKKSQTAHIMEHLAFGPNEQFDSLESFSQEFTKNGAYHNARTSNIALSYDSDAPLMEWDRILDLQKTAITKPTYTEEYLESEKGNVREELQGYANNHHRVLWGEIMNAAQLHRWYDAREVTTIDGVTLEDIKEHFQRTHTLKNMKFMVAGNLAEHRDAIIQKLEAWDLPAGESLEIPKDTARPLDLVHVYRKDLPSPTFNLMLFLNRQLSRSERQTMNVLSHALTGTFHSRIFGTVRKQGICYGMHTYDSTSVMGVSEFSISGQVAPKNAKAVFEVMIQQLKDVQQHSITEKELQQAKEYDHGSTQMSHETVSSLVDWYDEDYYELDEIDDLDKLPDIIDETTIEDVQKLLDEFLRSGVWTLGIIGNLSEEDAKMYHAMFENELIKAVQ